MKALELPGYRPAKADDLVLGAKVVATNIILLDFGVVVPLGAVGVVVVYEGEDTAQVAWTEATEPIWTTGVRGEEDCGPVVGPSPVAALGVRR